MVDVIVESDTLEKDIDSETLAVKRLLKGKTGKLVYYVGIACSLFHLWVNTYGIMPEIQRNAMHFAFILFMGFLTYPFLKRFPVRTLKFDYFLAILAFCVGLYLIFFEDALHARNEVPNLPDLIAAGTAVILMLEVTRRTTGWLIPGCPSCFCPTGSFWGSCFPACGIFRA